jgi:quinol monooxygenase YgiN
MFSLFGKFTAHEGKRDELIGYILEASKDMAGCILYVLNKSPEDKNAIYIYEVWENEEAHKASLTNESVKTAIQKAMPLIANMSDQTTLIPIEGSKGI